MTRLLIASCVLVAALAPSGAHAKGPVVTVTPDSGGPGTIVTLTGKGFCARSGCSVVSLTLAGRRFAPEQTVPASGEFTVRTQVSGGFTSGVLEVDARQTLEDGNTWSASAWFTYSPSKGEEAEREAETRDLIGHLENPSVAVASPKGEPLASFGASAGATIAAPSSGAGADVALEPASRTERSGGVRWPVYVLAGALAALVTIAAGWRRRRRPADPAGGTA